MEGSVEPTVGRGSKLKDKTNLVPITPLELMFQSIWPNASTLSALTLNYPRPKHLDWTGFKGGDMTAQVRADYHAVSEQTRGTDAM